MEPSNLIKCADYDQRDCRETELDGLTLYIPSSGDQTGYHAFPSTTYLHSGVHLRGDSVEDGLRLQEQ